MTVYIHALREEGDSNGCAPRESAERFLSTPSARRATRIAPYSGVRHIVSIHALREEGDGADLGAAIDRIHISIHALREEGDGGTRQLGTLDSKFLSTPSARRATRYPETR